MQRTAPQSLIFESLGDSARFFTTMKSVFLTTLLAFAGVISFAADVPTQPTLDDTKVTLEKISLGMTRAQAEATLGPKWKMCGSTALGNNHHALYYLNPNLNGQDVEIHYAWTSRRSDPGDLIVKLPTINHRQPTIDAASAMAAKIKLGMTRSEVEAILNPTWQSHVSSSWASGDFHTYRSSSLPGYYISVHYAWTGNSGIGRHAKPEDKVISVPGLLNTAESNVIK